MENVVIGAAMNYGVEQIKNFVLSFRKYNTEDDIILIYHEKDVSNIEKFISEHNVILASSSGLEKIPIHVVASRFFKYLDISNHLRDNTQYKNILFADVRDIFFQSNPFADLPEEDYIFAFTEDPAVKIDKEFHHIKMIERMFDPTYINKFQNKEIICSGTILGTPEKLCLFFKEFCDFLVELYKKNPSVCNEMLIDQVIANELFYFGQMKNEVVIKSNGDIVGTIGHCITHPDHLGEIKFDNGVITLDGKIPSVIHQYDRSPELFKNISELYHVN